VDAGTVRTDTLERMAAEGKIDLSEFYIINQQKTGDFFFVHSTRLYPEWPFAKAEHTPDSLAEKVAIALLSMSPNSPAATAGKCAGWTIPLNYEPVHECLKELSIDPYKGFGDITFIDVLERYWHWFILSAVVLLFMVVTTMYVVRLNRRLNSSKLELEKYSEELQEASRHKSQFLANMSHELRTPLNSIIGYTKLMLDGLEGDINEEQRKDLDTVYRNSQHLLTLINDLLDLAKIEAGKIVLSYKTFLISDLLSEVIPTIEQLAREKELTLTYSVAPGIDSLYADEAKTKQVLINILGNAIKFTNEGSVKLNVAENDSDFIFSVTDTGMGMKKEDLEAIFDSFEQVGPAQIAGYEGTGLGLAISKQFIEMQGGKIWAESELGKGSIFTFALPKKKMTSP